MADNTQLSTNIGVGDVIATDDIGGIKYPRSKITLGADNTNDGDVSLANPMPVTAGTGVTLPTSNAVLAAAIGTPAATAPTSAVQVGVRDSFGVLKVPAVGITGALSVESNDVVELLHHIRMELIGIRLALTTLVTETGHNSAVDFDPDTRFNTGYSQ